MDNPLAGSLTNGASRSATTGDQTSVFGAFHGQGGNRPWMRAAEVLAFPIADLSKQEKIERIAIALAGAYEAGKQSVQS